MKNILILFSIFLLHGCSKSEDFNMKDIVPFSELNSYMEVSEENDSLVFRALLVPKSSSIVGNFHLSRENGAVNKHVFSLFESSKNQINPKIKYTNWGGLEIIFPKSEFSLTVDQIWYKDLTGEYPIVKGNKKSWKRYLEKKYKETAIPQEKINEILDSI